MLSLKPVVLLLTLKPVGFAHKWFRSVGGAAEFAQALDDKLPLPMAWVVRAEDSATPVGSGTADNQVAFDVVIAIENVRASDTFETDELLLSYRRAVLFQLLGYEVVGAIKPISFKGGQVVDYLNGELFWRDRYHIQQMVDNYLPDPPTTPPAFDLQPQA